MNNKIRWLTNSNCYEYYVMEQNIQHMILGDQLTFLNSSLIQILYIYSLLFL